MKTSISPNNSNYTNVIFDQELGSAIVILLD